MTEEDSRILGSAVDSVGPFAHGVVSSVNGRIIAR